MLEPWDGRFRPLPLSDEFIVEGVTVGKLNSVVVVVVLVFHMPLVASEEEFVCLLSVAGSWCELLSARFLLLKRTGPAEVVDTLLLLCKCSKKELFCLSCSTMADMESLLMLRRSDSENTELVVV